MNHALVPATLPEDPPAWLLEMLGFLSFADRAAMLSVNKSWAQLTRWPGWWKAQCRFAAEHFNLFCPQILPASETWLGFFEDLWSVRHLWSGKENAEARQRREDSRLQDLEGQRIQVFARLKPATQATMDDAQELALDKGEEEEKDAETKAVMLPLHQRLALIKLQFPGREVSSREALQILQRQGDWFQGAKLEESEETSESAKDDDGGEKPASKQMFEFKIHNVNEADGNIVMTCPNVGIRSFDVNGIFGECTSQDAVYDRIGRKLVVDCLNGWNGTLFVYGQTGSGKTYTMYYGPDDGLCTDGLMSAKVGLVPRVCVDMLRAVEQRNESKKVRADLALSYVEVYNEQVFDLLRGGQAVGRSSVAAQRYVLSGQAQMPVHTHRDVESLLRTGEESKTKAATKMNDRSTRGHTLIIMTLKQRCLRTGAEVESHLFMGDLGGSERLEKSKAEGQNLLEATHINMGLLALKKVIAALNRSQRHIPYKDSKLTMLMAAGLGGSSRTRAVVCVNSDPRHAAETLETLRFGEECSLVKNRRRENNASLVGDLVREIDHRIKELENVIRNKEKWETVEVRRVDAQVEQGTFEETLNAQGGEMVRTTRLVGAEEEHEQLQRLHERRRQLLGIAN
ncbi:Kinesin-like protein [Hondaea fermentalgiana]|uniref:Kinesin-like protein n=1 Tax=Hondaea fermentalgiana TaxID=2315210 RepID=A0A2R5G9A7_9STRA|nr:Kinesin-like protein [Hondaea fermentalgiana]|eukprot:GBG26909.1 Kinesin-like protein [Hondaea fermentalgiana]